MTNRLCRQPCLHVLMLCVAALLLVGCGKRDPIVFTYERISADGGKYAGSGLFEKDPWACVQDLRTHLMWEVKSPEPGLHHAGNTYTWHYPAESDNYTRGDAGKPDGGTCSGSGCDTYAYAQAVNAQGLCGQHDWRVPSKEELGSIIDPRIKPPGPTLMQAYFPHTVSADYWTSSAYAYHSPGAWMWGFQFGLDRVDLKENAKHVRLVRGTASVRPAPPRGPKN